MNIMELGALGEFIGSIAVVGTLIYLAVQIRQNTKSMDEARKLALAQTYNQRATTNYEVWTSIGNGPLATILGRILETEALDSLSEEDRLRLRAYCFGNKNWFDNLHFQHAQGYYPNEFYESVFEKGVRIWAPIWNEVLPGGFRPEFDKQVERIVADPP